MTGHCRRGISSSTIQRRVCSWSPVIFSVSTGLIARGNDFASHIALEMLGCLEGRLHHRTGVLEAGEDIVFVEIFCLAISTASPSNIAFLRNIASRSN